ncbi:MAG: DUF3786 domain-containing protein [Blautia sp.]|nr:DUF3786 domain-containing protein [Blautia sp.]
MQKPSNYDKMSEAASRLFLTFDQKELLDRWSLPCDETYIYVNFISRPFRIERTTGHIFQEDRPCDCNEVLSIFDMLTRSPYPPRPSGEWVTLTQLTNAAGSGPVDTSHFLKKLDVFTGRTEELEKACIALGGTKQKVGDVSYTIPVFDNFPVWFQFWDADEEFPASITFLWDKTTPQHLHYETLWYIMMCVADRLSEKKA